MLPSCFRPALISPSSRWSTVVAWPVVAWFAVVSLAVASLFIVDSAAAQIEANEGPLLVDFSYQAEPECYGADRVFALVHRRSNRVIRADGQPEAQKISMTVVAEGGGYRGTLVVTRPGQVEERRSMKGVKCDEVVDALALTAALSIDPNATLTLGPAANEEGEAEAPVVPPPPPPVSEAKPPTKKPEVEQRPPKVSAPKEDTRLRVTVGAMFSVEKLMTHTVHLGGGLVLAASQPSKRIWFPLEMRLAAYFLTEPNVQQEGLISRFALARLSYCALRFGGELSLLLCPSAELGALWAESRGLEEDTEVTHFFATLGAEAILRARIVRRVELWVTPALFVPLTRRGFEVLPGPEEISSSVAVAWEVSSGIGWVF